MAQTCPQCQSQAGDDANHCPNCGAALHPRRHRPGRAGRRAASGGCTHAGAAAPAGAAGASAVPPFKFDAARWTLADRIAGVATLVLFICLFLPWFTYSFGFGSGSVERVVARVDVALTDPLHRDHRLPGAARPVGTNSPSVRMSRTSP